MTNKQTMKKTELRIKFIKQHNTMDVISNFKKKTMRRLEEKRRKKGHKCHKKLVGKLNYNQTYSTRSIFVVDSVY